MSDSDPSLVASQKGGDEAIEVLGLAGTTLMLLWGIGVARVSDLMAYDTESLRKRLSQEQQRGTAYKDRIEKAIADIHAAVRSRHGTTRLTQEPPKPMPRDDAGEPSWKEMNAAAPSFAQGAVQLFLRDVRKYPLLSVEQLSELGRRVRENEDKQAEDLLVLHNLRLVLSIARRYLYSKLDYADLIQQGVLGLIIAAKRYDYRKGFAFTTYATWWVRQSITRAIIDFGGTIHIPVHLEDTISKVRRAMNEIAAREGRPPTIDEIVALTKLEPKKVWQAIRLSRVEVVSLSAPVSVHSSRMEDGSEIGDLIEDLSTLRADHLIEAREELMEVCERTNRIVDMLYEDEKLSDRDRQIFTRRYGLDGTLRERTLEQVSGHYDITRERARQIIVRLWERLQDAGLDMDHDSMVEDLARIGRLENLAGRRVSVN